MKNVQYPNSEWVDGILKQWLLGDTNPKKIWRVKLLIWNEVARKFARQLRKATRFLISNFLV